MSLLELMKFIKKDELSMFLTAKEVSGGMLLESFIILSERSFSDPTIASNSGSFFLGFTSSRGLTLAR
jgi:hypothetical protein